MSDEKLLKETDEFIIGEEARTMGGGNSKGGGSWTNWHAEPEQYIMCKKCKKKSFNEKDIRYEWLHCCQKFATGGAADFQMLADITEIMNPRYLHATFDWKNDTELTEMQRMTKAIWAILKDPKMADVILYSTNGRQGKSET